MMNDLALAVVGHPVADVLTPAPVIDVNLHDTDVMVRGGLHDGRVEALWTIDACGCVA